jgi:hypothetical protein
MKILLSKSLAYSVKKEKVCGHCTAKIRPLAAHGRKDRGPMTARRRNEEVEANIFGNSLAPDSSPGSGPGQASPG